MQTGSPIRILLADDHTMFRAGIRSVLEHAPHLKVVGEAGDGPTAVRMAAERGPDIVLMDITMPLLNGVEAARQVRAQAPEARVITLSMHTDWQFVSEALKVGVCGYLLKSSAAVELSLAIEAALRGEIYLSPSITAKVVAGQFHPKDGADSALEALTHREQQVLQLLAEGKTNKEIAACLNIGAKTVETHRAQIMEKLAIRNVAGLTKFAIRHGLTGLEM